MPDCDSAEDRRPLALSRIIEFHQDEDGHWVVGLSCGHTQHLRHQPPWQNRDWVNVPEQRQARLGQSFACGWCARLFDSSKDC